MNQPGVSQVPRRSEGKSSRILRAGNITNSVVIVGDNNQLVLNGEGNAIVDRLGADQRPSITYRPIPVFSGRPTHPINLLDRETEQSAVHSALRSGNTIEFCSKEGVGKTTLLRYFASQLQMRAGMVYLPVKGRSLEDIFQEIFEAFLQSDRIYKPTQVEYRRYFEQIQALILLDDIALTRDEIQILRDTLPNCVFVLSAVERSLWEQGQVILLSGLPLNAAMSLFRQHLGRQLSPDESRLAEWICAALQGHPLQIIQIVARVRDEGKTLQDVARQIQSAPSEEHLLENSLARLSDQDKRILAVLATLEDVPMPAEHIAEILQNRQIAQPLGGLLNHGLVKAHSPQYSLTGNLGRYLNRAWNLNQWKEVVLRYFVDWTTISRPTDKILEAGEVLLAVIENAANSNRWQEVQQIGIAIEPSFVIGKRWGAWGRLLRLLMQASQRLGDRAIEAWVLHELGSRALCLGNLREAQEFLTQALSIRRVIGDQSGASATQHNLSLLGGGPPSHTPRGSQGGPHTGGWIIPVIGGVMFTAIVIAGAIVAGGRQHPPVTPLVLTNTPTYTVTPSITTTENPTFTPTPSHTITPSLTTTENPTFTPTPSQTFTSSFTPTDTITPTPTDTLTPPLPYLLLATDLSGFYYRVMLYQGEMEDYFQIPVFLYLENLSDIEITEFDISMNYEAPDGSHRTQFQIRGQSNYQDSMSIASLLPYASTSYDVNVIIPRSYAGTSINLVLNSDRCLKDINCEYGKLPIELPYVIYDFIDHAPQAHWVGYDPNIDEEYEIKFNEPDQDSGEGFAGMVSGTVLEDGTGPYYILETYPAWAMNGNVEGLFSQSFGDLNTADFLPGDRLIARFGFMEGGNGDGVTFHLNCISNSDPYSIPVLIDVYDSNEGNIQEVVIPLSDQILGCNLYDLWVEAGYSPDDDQAVWIELFVERP